MLDRLHLVARATWWSCALSADLVEEADFAYAGGQAAAARLLEHAPTAIFATNDQMALGTLAELEATRIGPRLPVGVRSV
jgi:DNA-binding LacI/PurR family transcriptional regulator